MVSSGARRTIIAVVIVGSGIAAWQFWPTDARRIGRKLNAIESLLNERPSDGVGRISRTVQLSKFVTDDVVLEPGRGEPPIQGRERLLALASRAPSDDDPFALSLTDVSIEVTEGGRATVRLTATVSRPDADAGESVDTFGVELEFQRTDDWRIARITLVEALENRSS